MQKSYLVKQSVDFGQTSKFLIRPGDILVFDSQNQNKITVYRNGEIMKVLPNQSLGGLSGLVKSNWITEIHGNDAPKHGGASTRIPAPRTGKPASGSARQGSTPSTGTAVQPPKASRKQVADSTV